MQFTTFPDFIRAKGLDTICSVCEAQPGTIRSYLSRGWIPRDKWPELLKAFPELGLNDLLAMELAAAEENSDAAE